VVVGGIVARLDEGESLATVLELADEALPAPAMLDAVVDLFAPILPQQVTFGDADGARSASPKHGVALHPRRSPRHGHAERRHHLDEGAKALGVLGEAMVDSRQSHEEQPYARNGRMMGRGTGAVARVSPSAT
jgi:hypothetical protein